jgi:tetratricopeptide (TPR) repeat protein
MIVLDPLPPKRSKRGTGGLATIAGVLRLILFFVLAAALAFVLGHVPFIGPLFAHTGLIGILIAAALLSAVVSRVGERMLTARKLRGELRALGAVGNAHTHGKMGALYLARGRPRASLEHLEIAARGEPQVAEWQYRLGLARLAVRQLEGALEAFERCVELEEEHAYGAAQMRRAECMQRLKRHGAAFEALRTHERNHGPSPEAAFRRGQVLRALGRRSEARAAFAEVAELARNAARYQRRAAGWWALRAGLARVV